MCRGWEEKMRGHSIFCCFSLGIKCWRKKMINKKRELFNFSLADEFVCAAKNPSERYHSLQQTDFTTNWILLCRSFLLLLLFLFFSHLFHLFLCCYIFVFIVGCIVSLCLSVGSFVTCYFFFNGFMGFDTLWKRERINKFNSSNGSHYCCYYYTHNKEGDCRQILYNNHFFSSFNFIVIYDL